MQRIPEINSGDVWQWLGGGWHIVEIDGVKYPAELLERDEDGEFHQMTTDGTAVYYDPSHTFIHWPRCGALNMKGYALYLNRTPHRQYRRTYNSRCLEIEVPRRWDVMKRYPEAADVHPNARDIVDAAFNPVYPGYSEACDRLRSDTIISVAINPYVIIAGDYDGHLVYYRGTLLGEVKRNVFTPMTRGNPQTRRIMKWFEGRVTHES